MDFIIHQGGTPSTGTGPSGAFEGKYYIYTEATGNYSKTAFIDIDLDLTTLTDPVISFAYHMYGSKQGNVKLQFSNYKPLGEEMDLDKTWDDTFGDKAQELADKQRNFAMRDKVKVGDILYKDGRKGKVVKVMSDMANVDFGGGDVYGITFRRIKGDQIEESVNEGYLERAIEDEKDPKKLAMLKAKKEFYDNNPKEKRREMSDEEEHE